MKSGRFHEIQQISWNPWNLADFRWNLADFMKSMKSAGFHHEIQWISPRYHLWNPPKIIKASVSVKTLQFDECRVGDFTLKSGGFHLWNPPKIIKASVLAKTLQFDECRVGAMTKDFMKSTRFHPGVWWISPMKSGRFHPDFTCKIHPNYKSKCFSKNSSVWLMQGRGYDQGFHEIHQISPWNLADLTCEIQWISPRYHLWNPPKIIKASVSAKTLQFDECRVGDFTLEIQWISPWNLVDFNHEIWWISPVKSTQNYKSKCFSKNSSVWWMQGGGYDQGFHEIHQISPWNLVDFTCEIQQSSPRFHLWNPPKIIKANVSAKTLQFDECRVGAMTKDFMKSAGFHMKFTWNLPDFMKSSGFQNYELLHDDQV